MSWTGVACEIGPLTSTRYPSKMIPGCHIIVKTTADTDRDARILLNSLGIPFYGKFRN